MEHGVYIGDDDRDPRLLNGCAPDGAADRASLLSCLGLGSISAKLGIPGGSIGPDRARCVGKLRPHPAIAVLIDAGSASGR